MFVMIGEVSIHAPYIGSDKMLGEYNGDEMVSIHAPYIGSDVVRVDVRDDRGSFNPRSLHRERLCIDT